MSHNLLRFAHILGAVIMAAGLVGVFVCDLRARRAATLAEAQTLSRLVALFYDAVVVPGAVLVGGAGLWLVLGWWGWGAFQQPWLVAMMVLFALEFVEGNTITRLAFLRLDRLTRAGPSPALWAARRSWLATFTHFLDLPVVAVLLWLGMMRPLTWPPILVAVAGAVLVATAASILVPRWWPWRSD